MFGFACASWGCFYWEQSVSLVLMVNGNQTGFMSFPTFSLRAGVSLHDVDFCPDSAEQTPAQTKAARP